MQELRRDFIIYFNLKIKVWDSKYNELKRLGKNFWFSIENPEEYT